MTAVVSSPPEPGADRPPARRRAGSLLGRIAVDTSALRASRDFRLLAIGNFITGLGTQATLVALPYQVYVQTRSPLLTGLLGAVELLPIATMSLYGGALADRMDRRRLLLIDQLALVAISGGALRGRPRPATRRWRSSTSWRVCWPGRARSRTWPAARSSRTSSPRSICGGRWR